MQKYIIAILGTVVLAGCGSVSVDDDWDADADVEEDALDESETEEADVVHPDVPETVEDDAALDEAGSDEADVVHPDDAVEPDEGTDIAPVCPDDMDCTGLACGPDPVCGESCGGCADDETCEADVCACIEGETRGCSGTDLQQITYCDGGDWITRSCSSVCELPDSSCCTSEGRTWCVCGGTC